MKSALTLSFLLFHDRKSDETSRADLSDLEKGGREAREATRFLPDLLGEIMRLEWKYLT